MHPSAWRNMAVGQFKEIDALFGGTARTQALNCLFSQEKVLNNWKGTFGLTATASSPLYFKDFLFLGQENLENLTTFQAM